jgi:hypothetical protein
MFASPYRFTGLFTGFYGRFGWDCGYVGEKRGYEILFNFIQG